MNVFYNEKLQAWPRLEFISNPTMPKFWQEEHGRFLGVIPFSWISSTMPSAAGLLNILKTTPTPDKNGSYGVKVGVRMP